MRPFISLIILVISAFVLWILPLGVYYSLAQEAELCGGKRAICLCKRAIQQIEKASTAKIYKTASNSSSTSVDDPAGSPKFIPAQANHWLVKSIFSYAHSQRIFLSDDGVVRAIDHVPICS